MGNGEGIDNIKADCLDVLALMWVYMIVREQPNVATNAGDCANRNGGASMIGLPSIYCWFVGRAMVRCPTIAASQCSCRA